VRLIYSTREREGSTRNLAPKGWLITSNLPFLISCPSLRWTRSFEQLQQCSRRMRMHDKARNTLHVMELRQRDAMIAYLKAHLELRDACLDDKDLDMEQYMAEMDAVLRVQYTHLRSGSKA
jgi:hypothetical protein